MGRCAASVGAHIVENSVGQFPGGEGTVLTSHGNQPVVSILLTGCIPGLGDPVGEEQQQVSRRQLGADRREALLFEHTQHHATGL